MKRTSIVGKVKSQHFWRNLIASISEHLLGQLPKLAQYLAGESWPNIDDPLAHAPNWHQWGVLEHTRQVWKAMTAEVPMFCCAWDVALIEELKAEVIQHQSKWELLLITCIVHDLGKWASRTVNASCSYSFKGHEAMSEHLLRHDPVVQQTLRDAGLLPTHVDYIASIAGLHYELGKLRRLGYQHGCFNRAFLKSDLFQAECVTIARRHKKQAREIGLIFLADSLAKAEFRPGIESIEEIEAKIRKQGLSRKLIQAVQQLPMNVAMCREYLLWLQKIKK